MQWRNSYELYPVRAGGTQAIGIQGGTLNCTSTEKWKVNNKYGNMNVFGVNGSRSRKICR
jgi:hypothetical protein